MAGVNLFAMAITARTAGSPWGGVAYAAVLLAWCAAVARASRLWLWWVATVPLVGALLAGATWLSARDGRTTRVAAPPVLSPSGQYAIAWDPSPLIGNPMELIDLRSDPPVVGKVMGMPACPGAGQQHGVRQAE